MHAMHALVLLRFWKNQTLWIGATRQMLRFAVYFLLCCCGGL
jgi:hypothetical protein